MFPRLLEISRPDLLRNPNACLSFFEQNEVLDTNIHKQIGTMTLTQIKDICSSASMSLPTPVLAVKLLTPDATLPTRGSAKAAGLDLFASQDALLAWGERKLISTGLCVKICENHYGRVAPRSGNAVKHGLTIGAGVIDEDYRGELKVLLFNLGGSASLPHQVKKGDRVAQLILEKISYPDVVQVDDLDLTDRGGRGFGSTGQ